MRSRRATVASTVIVLASTLGVAGCGSSGGDSGGSSSASAPAGGSTSCPKADGSSPKRQKFTAAPPMCIDTTKTYTATMTTDAGDVVVTLDAKKAPKTVNNFVVLARYHFFDGTTFHRVIPGFMAQGGDPEGTGNGGPGYEIPDELPKLGEYRVGSLAMANASAPNTGGSQFFIVTGPAGTSLPPQYSLFGQVKTGMNVVTKIEADGSSPDDNSGTPKKVHTLKTVTITER